MHSGQNPCSGVGIARCLRAAFPNLTLVGVDHWQGSSGLHDKSIDETLLLPQWKQINDAQHGDHILSILNDDHLWIAAMDMEVHWLAEHLGAHSNLLAPGAKALELTAKPAVSGLDGLGFRVPDFISASLPDSDIHYFLRQHAWQCWLKSPYHDAKRISSWIGFVKARDAMAKSWRTSKLFLQRHIIGSEETIAFAAYQGELIAAAHMQKRQITPEGKTWAARVTAVEPDFLEGFKEAIRKLNYTGGGEVEFARDPDGHKWLIECNPRFPAWVYGGALAGQNVVAKLIAHVWNMPFLETVNPYPFFTRVVQDIPAKESVGIPLPPDPATMAWASEGKKGKSGPDFSALIPTLASAQEQHSKTPDKSGDVPEHIDPSYFTEISSLTEQYVGPTPARIHLEQWARGRFDRLAKRVKQASLNTSRIQIGFSVKTCPTDDYLRKAKESGFFAECISQMEVQRALSFGFLPSQIILNGPGKFWPLTDKPVTGLHALYCDSPEEFDRVIALPGIAKVIGFRMRVPKVHSRFGNPLDDPRRFSDLIHKMKKLQGRAELGFHFHMPSWAIGLQTWMQALDSLLIWCQIAERLSGRPVKHLDLGGGFFPADLERLDISGIQESVRKALPNVGTLYLEPGRSLTQDGEILVSRILDLRKTPDASLHEIVVDACIAELPLAQAYSHRLFFKQIGSLEANSPPVRLSKGETRILGRICMEDDILSDGVSLPESAQIGDYVIFGDAGGYERSMSYGFGRG